MDLYKVLGVSRAASLTEIKTAYRRLALQFHPDVAGKDDPTTRERFQQISAAYNTLSNEISRRAFDQTIGNRRVSYPGPGSSNSGSKPSPFNPRASRNRRGGQVSPEHFNMSVWNAWHYGDNATATPSVTNKSRVDAKANEDAAYFARRQKEQEKARAERAQAMGTDSASSPPQKKEPPPECVIS